MTDMIERVARAIGKSLDEHTSWETAGSGFKEICTDAAKAAIEAMRDMEPSDRVCEHLESDLNHMTTFGSLCRAHQAMIDAALEDETIERSER